MMNDPKGSVNAWWNCDSDQRGKSLVDTVKGLMAEQTARRVLAETQLAGYVGCSPEELTYDVWSGVYPPTSPTNLIRRIVDSVAARVFAKQRPKAQITTAGANYKTRLMARQQSKFLLATLYQPQDGYSDSWELLEQVGRDSLIYQAGVMKAWADPEQERIVHARAYISDIYVDPLDAEYGAPKNLFHVYRYDKYQLAALFPKHKSTIMEAESYPGFQWSLPVTSREDQVCVYEGWRLPIGRNKPGRHVIAVSGSSGSRATLVDEEWADTAFPFVFIRYKRQDRGFFAHSLVDEILTAQQLLDEVFEDLKKNVRAVAGGYMLVTKGQVKSDDALRSNDTLKIIELDAKVNGIAPQIHMPQAFSPSVMQWLQLLRQNPHDLSGMSEMTSRGLTEPGIESGVARRVANDLQSELFLPQSRSYERSIVQLARLDMAIANQIVDSGQSLSTVLPSEGFLDEIDWKDIRFPSDQYKVTIQASSSFEDSVASRKQRVVELAQSGSISPATADRLLDSGSLDLEQVSGRVRAQIGYIERIISTYQNYDEEADKGLEEQAAIVVGPDPLLDVDLAILQLTEAYVEMLEMGAPETNLRLVRELISQYDQMQAQTPSGSLAPGVGGQAMGAPSEHALPPQTEQRPNLQQPPMGGDTPPMGGLPGLN